MSANDPIVKLFAAWAKSKGIAKPATKEGMQALYGQFVSELQAKATGASHVIGAAGDATYANDPISKLDAAPIIMRNSGGLVDIMEPENEESDWTEMVRDKQRALEEAGGDDLAAHVIYRKEQRAEIAAQASLPGGVPQSLGGAQLGQQASVVSGGDVIQVARWDGANDAEARVMSVVITPIQPVLPAAASGQTSLRPFARVHFGTSGFLTDCEVDIGNGCEFAVPGSSVQVDVGMDPTSTSYGTAGRMILSAMISPHVVARAGVRITRTRYLDSDAGNPTVSVPRFAKDLTPYRTTTANAYTIVMQDQFGNSLYSVPIAATVSTCDPILLAGDVQLIQVVPTGGSVGAVRLIFGLSL